MFSKYANAKARMQAADAVSWGRDASHHRGSPQPQASLTVDLGKGEARPLHQPLFLKADFLQLQA